MQPSHRGLYLALVVSLVVHASVLVSVSVKEPALGQHGTERYVTAQLSNDQPISINTPKPVSRTTPTNAENMITAVNAAERITVADPREEDNEPEKATEEPQGQTALESGMRNTASGTPDYLAAVLQRIDANKQYPYRAWRRQIEGTVDIRMLVYRDGSARVENAESNSAVLSQAAKQAISSAQPFPTPDANGITTPVRLSFTMEF
ncbi:MAG: hypothetical protein AMJ69_13020, partial [Gammaproteobacteria bacterium SG8_47]